MQENINEFEVVTKEPTKVIVKINKGYRLFDFLEDWLRESVKQGIGDFQEIESISIDSEHNLIVTMT